jgi:hypothetical protein
MRENVLPLSNGNVKAFLERKLMRQTEVKEVTFNNVEEVSPGLVEAALEVARERHAITQRLHDALVRHDDLAALDIARELCGLSPAAERNH